MGNAINLGTPRGSEDRLSYIRALHLHTFVCVCVDADFSGDWEVARLTCAVCIRSLEARLLTLEPSSSVWFDPRYEAIDLSLFVKLTNDLRVIRGRPIWV